MNKIDETGIRLFLYFQTAGNKAKQILNKPELLFIAVTLLIILAAPTIAYAWDPKAGANNVLDFVKFIIIIVVAVMVVKGLLKSQMVFALTVVIVGGILYLLIDESPLKTVAGGILNLIGINNGSE